MWLRANITLAIAVVFAIVQMFASVTGGPRVGDSNALASAPNSGLTRSVAAQDDNEDDDDEDEDNDDEDDDDDNDDSDSDNDEDDEDNDDSDSDNDDDEDNDDSDSDNDDDEDNDDEDSDNDDEDDSDNDDEDDSDNDDEDDLDDELDDELDNVEVGTVTDVAPATTTTAPTTATAPVAQAGAVSPVASPVPVTEAQLVTTGMDATLALQTDRVMLQVFATMPSGMTLKLRLVDPLQYPSTPGIRAGNLIFVLEATDSAGMIQQVLPGEVNLSVRYTDADVTGLDDTATTMARLDQATSSWTTAPKLVTDPLTNYLAASVMDTGVYAVYVP